jgi:DHA2 family multidrug resistance protein
MSDVWRPRHNPWTIAMTVTLATFMEVLDTSIANVALPHIAGGLSAGQDASTWVLTSYLVSNAIVVPISGWIASRIGRKRFYMTCVALFTVSSFLCGLAPNLPALIFFRVLQGVGGGGLQPSEQAILADTFPPEKRGMAFAIYGMAVVLAPAIGPTLGGYITDNASWRWIFFINVPVGLLSLLLTHQLVEDPPYFAKVRSARIRVDYIGLSLIVIGLGSLQYVLDKGEREDWFGSPVIVAFASIAGVALLAMVLWELFQKDPIVDLRLLGSRGFGISALMMFILGLVLFGSTVLLPLFLQTMLGYTAELAGKVLSPGGLVVLVLLPIVGRLLGKVQARWLIAFGFLSTALAMFHMTDLNLEISFSTAMMYRIYLSVGLAFLFVPINTIAYTDIPPEKNNQVSSIVNLARNLGGSVGISLATTLIARRAQHHQVHLVGHLTPYDPSFRQALDALTQTLFHRGVAFVEATRQAYGRLYGLALQQAATLAYIDAVWVLGMLSACMLPLVFLLPPNRPGERPAGAH